MELFLDVLFEELHRGNALGEYDDALLGILLPDFLQFIPECCISRVDARSDVGIDQIEQFLHFDAVIFFASLFK